MSTQHESTEPETRRRSRLRGIAATVSILALVGGIGGAQARGVPSAPHPSAPAARSVPSDQPPPPVRLSSSGIVLAVKPYTACWFDGQNGFCYDGIPPHPLPSLGGRWGPMTLSFARDGWHFSVSAVDSSGHRTKVALVRLSERKWRFALAQLPAGRYRIDLFGKGPEGDVAAGAAFTLNR